MTKNLLIELGLEEMPAYVVTPSMKQLRDKMGQFLKEERLSFDKIEMFSTPRRLAVRVVNLADYQTDLVEEFKGPAKQIALDENGEFTKAAQGFVRGKGLTVDDITFRDIKGTEYVYVTKKEAGKPAKEVLKAIPELLKSLTFPVSMHWASNRFDFIRPVHTLIVLLNDEMLEMDFLDITSNRISRGHRFLGKEVAITSADSYEDDLRKEFVITNSVERENMIVEQIKAIEKEKNVAVEIDEQLLNEVLNLVEYPTAFMGSFDVKYLDIPEEVLITSMKSHQRYFVVRNQNGQLLPHFISVRNGNDKGLQNVIQGNEKVLLARLEDGEFFWREDQKLKIDDLVEKLKQVTFHEKIGSLYEHMERVEKIANLIGRQLHLSNDELDNLNRASKIYKFDLLTGMVGEFDELQGIMGEKYALLAGEKPDVATAIREHYMPISAEGELPDSLVGALLAISDKLDTLLSFFSVDLIPSGSNDPYALRRATQGIVRILDKFGWSLSLEELITSVYQLDVTPFNYTNQSEVMSFILARIEKMMGSDISKDIIEAVLSSSTSVVRTLLETSLAIFEKARQDDFKTSVESLSRVFNLADKANSDKVDESLFENSFEEKLYQATKSLDLAHDMSDNLDNLFALSPIIDAFFDNTMVMVDNQALKDNRLAILAQLRNKANQVATFNKINTK
ncbi:glycine--tRNA ligase subunit beta [Streptococcus sp. CSL10205-OR2]|uniref:glycine--tRNA ligase subunit beta n=1 Tax=Streptococcus sp. CSL10205-OR2 TaxID=2980558 RepID=UPI0021DA87F8|nr:glycine--tRNA ligase subunit beta [Streptococcus sp. CSL10205-OR2]MCU9532968.1 glycine--tRNA ligase subunit beta [Streptococcus sp. CSL10205-OR2]